MKKIKDFLLIPFIILIVWLGLKWYKAPIFSQGTDVPNFVGYLPDGDSIQLADFKGQIVLLDFWGSWCGPCRQNNRSLVNIYRQYKDASFINESKFTIISIGAESRKSSWLAAIEKDGLVWPYHISDLKRLDDHVALLYGIKEIPTTYLLDGNQNILKTNPTEQELNEILSLRLQK